MTVRHGSRVEILEDEADVPPAPGRRGRFAEHLDRARRRREQIGDDAQKRGLAAARRADDRQELAVRDLEVETGQNLM